jgi:hypothetical protein
MQHKKHVMPPSERAGISETIAARLNQSFPEVVAAYIFGSFVGQGDFGDIDVGVLLLGEELPPPLKYELSMESALEKEVRLPADVRVLNSAPLSFQHHVTKSGSLIIDKDPNRRAAFEGKVRKQYFDFSRFRKRYLKEVAHA